ncbi:MAG: UDP-N-acetylmuramate--L-alanine ligase [Treponema sp.]|jgi:UDP-N-acetylmuramate--alanine ligase|nr:UDP-N-acetylmuramate--L-alanine ligase [Treponema sp.]
MEISQKGDLPARGNVYFVGIKGTGMCALAELLHNTGFRVSGSDRDEVFYTDAILKELGIPYRESFDTAHLGKNTDLVIYSAAYSPETNPELREAEKRGIPLLKYPEALGAYSARFDASGIAGVHGKTTTAALAGTLIRGAGLPAQVLAGSAVSGFGGRSTLNLGNKYFVAETCEYRKHFLSFHPRRIVLTSVESDHQDYFPTYGSIREAFLEYTAKLPPGGELIYCADDPGAAELALTAGNRAAGEGRPVILTPYGFTASGPFRIDDCRVEGERQIFNVALFPGELRLRVPGRHAVLDAVAALALTNSLMASEYGDAGPDGGSTADGWTAEKRERVCCALEEFRGSKRRSEIVGERNGILFMDDYGHHPTAIKTTLAGLREFYPDRRIVVSFMSHTYTRTAALLDEFAASFEKADIVFLHKIYASAREINTEKINGRTLYEKVLEKRDKVYYTEEPEDAANELDAILRPGDLFITIGAGDNWKLGKKLFDFYRQTGLPARGNN